MPDLPKDPKGRTLIGWLCASILAGLGLVVRVALDVDGVLDTDAINFGLGALRFDVMQHQPHPPGYPGYVLLLRGLHGLATWLDPIGIAKWGSRLLGAVTVLAAFGGCRLLLADRAGGAIWRPTAAAALAALHPLLWYYGADGQSHAAEGLFVLLLACGSAAVRASRRTHWWSSALLGAAFALAGSIRPTVPLFSLPFGIWALWGRGWRHWTLAGASGLMAAASWLVPLVQLSGGWRSYLAASDALWGELFFANYSPFGKRAFYTPVVINLQLTALGLLLAGLPLLAYRRRTDGSRPPTRDWRIALWAAAALHAAFFALTYVAELGYFTGLAALACLAPATWRAAAPAPRLRLAVALIAGPAFVLAAPGTIRLGGPGSTFLPTLRHAIEVEAGQAAYHRLVCSSADGRRSLALTDNPVTTHTRLTTIRCPNLLVAIHLHDLPLNPELDGWLIYTDRTMQSVPGPVPLRPGPSTAALLPHPVERVILAPDASPRFARQVQDQARCAPLPGAARAVGGFSTTVWPTRCLPELRIGKHVVRLRAEPGR